MASMYREWTSLVESHVRCNSCIPLLSTKGDSGIGFAAVSVVCSDPEGVPHMNTTGRHHSLGLERSETGYSVKMNSPLHTWVLTVPSAATAQQARSYFGAGVGITPQAIPADKESIALHDSSFSLPV